MYENKTKGAYFQSSDGSHNINIYMFGFVDDSSSSSNDFCLEAPMDPQHYVTKATKDAQLWNDLLKLSGGALESTKCSHHYLCFDFTMAGRPVLRDGKIDPAVQIYFNDSNAAAPLENKSAY